MKQENWSQPLRYAVVFAGLLIIVWFLRTASSLINSLIIAVLLAYVMHPLVNLFTKLLRVSHNIAVNLVYLLFLSAVIATPVSLTPIVIRQLGRIDGPTLLADLEALLTTSVVIGDYTIPINGFMADFEKLLTQTATDLASTAFGIIDDVSDNFLWILLILFTLYFLLRDGKQLIVWFIQLLPQKYHHDAYQLTQEIDGVWSNFLRGQIVLMVVVGVLSWLGAWAVGMPGAFVVGMLAGILDIVPTLGPTLAAIVAVTIALIEGSDYLPTSNFIFALIILGVFLLVQQIENVWIRPAVMGQRLKLHPAVIFIGVIGALTIYSVLAALIIVPMLATVGVFLRYFRQRIRGEDPYPVTLSPEDATLANSIELEESPLLE